MKNLEDFIQFEFTPDQRHLKLDNDECVTGRLKVVPRIDFGIAELSCHLSFTIKGSLVTEQQNLNRILLDKFTEWKKNHCYEFDVVVPMPQDFFSYKANWFHTLCAIDFVVVPNNATLSMLRIQFLKTAKLKALYHSFTSFSHSFPMMIENEGHFSILPGTCKLKDEYYDLRFYIGIALFCISCMMLTGGTIIFGSIALLGSIFLIMDGGYRKITMARLGKVTYSTQPKNKHQFFLTLEIPKAHRIKKLNYSLALEEVVVDKRHEHTAIYSELHFEGDFIHTSVPINETINIPIDYPDSNLVASLNGEYAKLEWRVNLNVVFNNRLAFVQKVQIQLIKIRQN